MLNVHSIFHSISGEVGGVPQGTQMTFIRLAGCNLKCHYCDTKDTQNYKNGMYRKNETIITEMVFHASCHVMITGGEPLLQEAEIERLISEVRKRGYGFSFSIETNGTRFPNEYLRNNALFIFDYKIEYSDKMCISNFQYDKEVSKFAHYPIVKFVIGDKHELEKACEKIQCIQNSTVYRPNFFIGLYQTDYLTYKQVYEYLRKKRLHYVGLNTQIHKILDFE